MTPVADRIRAALPEWARYRGYATRAITFYSIALGMGVLAYLAQGSIPAAATFAVFAGLALTLGSYYRSAAKLRVKCAQCGEAARGNDECPHCGRPTFTGEFS